MNIEKFYTLIKQGLSLDLIYILKQINSGISINTEITKVKTLLQTLLRKGFLSEDGKLTTEALNLINFADDDSVEVIVRTKVPEDGFLAFWEAFPSTDTFTYENVRFEGSRALKMNKTECKTKFDAIIKEGEYSVQEIIDAVKYDVLQKKKNSKKTGQNKLTYIQNSLTYLRQRSFVPFIELAKDAKFSKFSEHSTYPRPSSGCDI